MNYTYVSRRSLLLMCLLVGATCATAQTTAPAQRLFHRMGVISSLDTTTGSIVIGDTQYRLAPHARVYNYDRTLKDPNAQRAESQRKAVAALREGQRIGYNVEGEGPRQRGTLTEAWLLPAGPLPELQAGEEREDSGTRERKRKTPGPETPPPPGLPTAR